MYLFSLTMPILADVFCIEFMCMYDEFVCNDDFESLDSNFVFIKESFQCFDYDV
jgi:hypothetical protein